MPDIMRLYLDQMFHVRVADALRAKGHDALRVSEIGQERGDYIRKRNLKIIL
ncbi:DUF5615 family PIN-like protein [bacterium]|nr:DUF5615 family PIN-like protein [bacterium]